jgi:chemotaxis-related protein WspB
VAEKAVETIVVEQNCHEPQKVKIPDAPYLNGTIVSNGKLVQPLALDELLPAAVRALLFPDSEAS